MTQKKSRSTINVVTPTEQQTKEENNKNPNSSLHDNIDFCQIHLKIYLKGILIWNR